MVLCSLFFTEFILLRAGHALPHGGIHSVIVRTSGYPTFLTRDEGARREAQPPRHQPWRRQQSHHCHWEAVALLSGPAGFGGAAPLSSSVPLFVSAQAGRASAFFHSINQWFSFVCQEQSQKSDRELDWDWTYASHWQLNGRTGIPAPKTVLYLRLPSLHVLQPQVWRSPPGSLILWGVATWQQEAWCCPCLLLPCAADIYQAPTVYQALLRTPGIWWHGTYFLVEKKSNNENRTI